MLMSYACASLNRSKDLKSSIKENPPSFFIDVWEEGSTIIVHQGMNFQKYSTCSPTHFFIKLVRYDLPVFLYFYVMSYSLVYYVILISILCHTH